MTGILEDKGSYSLNTSAKINLFLRVLSKRSDGYHNISTLFVPVTIFDTITITKSDEMSLLCSDKTLEAENDNIILKTDTILRRDYGLIDKFAINLIKNIPIGGGLGGGSSDAACYMKLVNYAAKLNLNYDDMYKIMTQVGSDTAFFIKSVPSIASSRGEVLEEYNGLPELYFLIINPRIHISTKDIFNNSKLVLSKSAPTLKKNIYFSDLKDIMINDMENAVFFMYNNIKQLVYELNNEYKGIGLMSGSGSSVFGVYENVSDRDDAFAYFRAKYPDYFIKKAECFKELRGK